MAQDSDEYFRRRELMERAAAKTAASAEAQRVHQELAQAYARLRQAARPMWIRPKNALS